MVNGPRPPEDLRTPEEVAREGELRIEKHKTVVLDDSFEYRSYERWNQALEEVLPSPEDAEETADAKAAEFIHRWYDLLTEKPDQAVERVPGHLILAYFESSFKYFTGKVSDEVKNELVNLQLSLLTDDYYPAELRNAMLGVWGYWVNPDRRSQARTDREAEVRREVARVYAQLGQANIPEEERSRRWLELLDIANHSTWRAAPTVTREQALTQKQPPQPFDLMHEAYYYAHLYEREDKTHATTDPTEWRLKPILSELLQKELKRRPAGEETPEGKIRLRFHKRLLTFEHNLLPKTGRNPALYITENGEVLDYYGRSEILGDPLPNFMLNRYVARLRPTRYAPAYRRLSPEKRLQYRRERVVEIIRELLDPQSELRQHAEEDAARLLSAEELQKFRKTIADYQQSGLRPEELYLVTTIDINPEEQGQPPPPPPEEEPAELGV